MCFLLADIFSLLKLELGFAFKRLATRSPGEVLMLKKTEASEIALGIHINKGARC